MMQMRRLNRAELTWLIVGVSMLVATLAVYASPYLGLRIPNALRVIATIALFLGALAGLVKAAKK